MLFTVKLRFLVYKGLQLQLFRMITLCAMARPSRVLPRVLPFTQFYPGFAQLPRAKLGQTVQRFYPPTLLKSDRSCDHLRQAM